jgi:hypothetical protein
MTLEAQHGLFLELVTATWYMITEENPPTHKSQFLHG